jgi:hypothetical protein
MINEGRFDLSACLGTVLTLPHFSRNYYLCFVILTIVLLKAPQRALRLLNTCFRRFPVPAVYKAV